MYMRKNKILITPSRRLNKNEFFTCAWKVLLINVGDTKKTPTVNITAIMIETAISFLENFISSSVDSFTEKLKALNPIAMLSTRDTVPLIKGQPRNLCLTETGCAV